MDHIVSSERAVYVGISSYNGKRTQEAMAILKALGTPCLIHQPSYNTFNRWVETDGLLDGLDSLGMGPIAFTPLAQGLLTNKYLNGIPIDSSAMQKKSLDHGRIAEALVEVLRGLNAIAEARGQTLAQMALAWVLREGRVTSALIGASKPEQVVDWAGAIQN